MRRNKQEVTEMYRKMCGLRRQGKSRAEIAGAFGCSVSTVDRAIRLCGEKGTKRDRFEEHRTEVLQMYDAGATQKEIADAAGMSLSTINRRLRKMGMRRGSGWHPEGKERNQREQTGHREQSGQEEHLEVRQYAVHIRRAKKIRVRVGRQWKTMLDVSDWWM